MESIVSILACLLFLLLSSLISYILLTKRKREAEKCAKLPPGSMGWPFIGETLQIYSQDPNVFFATKQKRFLLSLITIYNKSLYYNCTAIILLFANGGAIKFVDMERYSKHTYLAAHALC